ncbi:MAG: inositol monophosphatase family protein [Actinomycetota bacterium]
MTLKDDLRALAVEAATEAGELLLCMEAGVTTVKSSPTDLVSEADHAAEALIFRKIMNARPDDSIVAEEGSVNQGTSGIRWVVDPLDGTINYIYGFPQWCVSIGVEGGERLGVVYDPNRKEIFTDTSPLLAVSNRTDLAGALIGTGFSYNVEVRTRQAALAARILPLVRDIRRAGSCALDLSWVAAGRLDAFYEEDVRHWDVSAGTALVQAAGGAVRKRGEVTLAAGTEELLDRLEALVIH